MSTPGRTLPGVLLGTPGCRLRTLAQPIPHSPSCLWSHCPSHTKELGSDGEEGLGPWEPPCPCDGVGLPHFSSRRSPWWETPPSPLAPWPLGPSLWPLQVTTSPRGASTRRSPRGRQPGREVLPASTSVGERGVRGPQALAGSRWRLWLPPGPPPALSSRCETHTVALRRLLRLPRAGQNAPVRLGVPPQHP